MRAVFLPSDLDGSGHYRLLFPMRELRAQHGWQAVMAPNVQEPGVGRLTVHYGAFEHVPEGFRQTATVMDVLLAADFDVLVMQQRGEPFWADVIVRLRAQGKRVLVDSDDAWLGLPSWNPGSRKPRAEVDAMLAQIAACDGMSVATPALAEMYRPYQENVTVIRNRLDWRMWADVRPVYEQRLWRRVRVGWMGELMWRRGDLEVLRGVLGPWLEQHPEVEFVAAGDPRVHEVLAVPPPQRVTTNRVNFWDGDLADITATFDIGLIPLDLTDPKARTLNECKSHLKGMEYNACGIPFIASPSNSYEWWLDGGGAGRLARNPREWRESLDFFVEAAGVRRMCAEAGRRQAEKHSLQAGGVDEWADWISSGTHPHAPTPALAA